MFLFNYPRLFANTTTMSQKHHRCQCITVFCSDVLRSLTHHLVTGASRNEKQTSCKVLCLHRNARQGLQISSRKSSSARIGYIPHTMHFSKAQNWANRSHSRLNMGCNNLDTDPCAQPQCPSRAGISWEVGSPPACASSTLSPKAQNSAHLFLWQSLARVTLLRIPQQQTEARMPIHLQELLVFERGSLDFFYLKISNS